MNICSYGGGTNSTALLIECVSRCIPVDLILFADTGGERPETYAYVQLFNDWLLDNGMPGIVQVKTCNKLGKEITLENWCLENGALPSIAYGFKSCSEKHKIRPINKYCNNNDQCKEAWKMGKITKFIGFDADESHRVKDFDDPKYTVKYPLVDWDMGRDECLQVICKAGLPQPGKSSCFFCPSMKANEIKKLRVTNPELIERALAMEANALPNLTSIKGLGRNWAWKDLLATADMFDEEFMNPIEVACGCYDG